ncbi:MAG: 50S ribosomal protein L10 [Thermodesulfobacteriota bacterium]
MNRDEKAQIVEELHGRFEKSKIVILTDYKGLNVGEVSDLRRKLTEAKVDYRVAKNTLIKRAAEGTDASKLNAYYKGPSAVALSYDDPVAPAKILTKFAAENDKLQIKMGVLNGKVIDPEGIKALSQLPSREILLGQLLSAMNGVATGLVRALNDVPVRLLNVLQAIKDKKEAA